jgi:hypothetical protein
MTAWVILIGFAVLVAGVLVKVGVDVARYLREDREAHGGRQTVMAAKRAGLLVVIVVVIVIFSIVWPFVFGRPGL